MRSLLLSLFILSFLPSQAQHKKLRLPLWTFHQSNVNIYGVGLGWFPIYETVNTTTNGLRLEVPGPGLFIAFIPHAPWDTAYASATPIPADSLPEKVNGINLSALGSMTYQVNGISLGLIGQVNTRANGLSFSAINVVEKHNGLLLGIVSITKNMSGIQLSLNAVSEQVRGIQIGFMTSSKNTRGLQFGLWNVNEKRKMPIVNWNFRS
ncbi:hypothetical protein [Chitinophaga caseinilytica]|uniref:DUF5723 domain-containing protein n=1 Tax=Chitinophaga caseinilytica TaxID=2267521 RepID=A0ABZ2YYW8_9BACT